MDFYDFSFHSFLLHLFYLVSLIFSRACTHASNLAIRCLDKPAHLFRFCNKFASPQILTQPSDFSGFWDTFATFLRAFLGFWDTFASFPRLSGSSAGVLPHLYGTSTTMCLQPQHFGCRRPPCKPYEGAGHNYILCTGLLVDLLTRRHETPKLTWMYAIF